MHRGERLPLSPLPPPPPFLHSCTSASSAMKAVIPSISIKGAHSIFKKARDLLQERNRCHSILFIPLLMQTLLGFLFFLYFSFFLKKNPPSPSLGFHAVLACLSKLGDDVIIEARPDRLLFSTMNITRSAHACFMFTRSFFESYHVDVTGPAIQQDAKGPFLRCKVLARALVSACKIRGNISEKTDKLNLVMDAAEGVGENCRLAIDIVFKHGKDGLHDGPLMEY